MQTPTERRFLFVLASTRRDGNTETLARLAADHLPPEAASRWLRLSDHPLPDFQDTRHAAGYGDPQGHALTLAQATLWATDLVIVTPVYWYSLPAGAKRYLDHFSGFMRAPSLRFRETLAGRSLWAVVVDSDTESEGAATPLLDTLRRTAEYLRMQWRGALQGHANRPGEILADQAALTKARSFFLGLG